MLPSEQVVDDLVDAILDGTPIDWGAAESSSEGHAHQLLRQLKVLSAVADVHRPEAVDTATIPPGTSASGKSHPEQAVNLWGHLRLSERIGRGAFGEVYRAWDTRLDREVALKLMPAGRPSGDRAASAIIHEGRLLARVRHPNVVTIYGADRIEDQIGLWMEFVRGQTLEQILAERKTLEPTEAIAIGVELCRATAAVHGADLLHRDIKTHNVMRAEDGRIVLMDFGTGRELDDDASSDLAGTPLYLAPEVLEGRAATVRSDIYSLGVLLYRLVTGSYPVYARTVRGVRLAHARGKRTPIRTTQSGAPPKLARIIERAIDPSPERRYQSAAAMGADLLALQPRPRAVRLAYAAGVASLALMSATAAWEVAGRQVQSSRTPSAWLGGLVGRNAPGVNVSPASSPVVVVLPFENLSAEPESDYFVDGLTDEIIRNLAGVEGLFVRSRTSSFAFKGKSRNLPEVGAILGANLVLEGSVLRSDRKVRIDLRLVQVAGEVVLWTERFDRQIDDVFAILDEVPLAIANKLRLRLMQGRRRYETNLEAYDLYLRARSLAERHGTADATQAAAVFQQVIARDPAFAPAHAGLVFAYAAMSMEISAPSTAPLPPTEALVLMRRAAQRALELDPLLPEAHAALGYVYSREHAWGNAQESFERALQLNPTLTQIVTDYVLSTLIPLGKLDEAEQLVRAALENDPLSLSLQRKISLLQLVSGRYEEAVETLERIRAVDKYFPFTEIQLARALTFAGRPEEALSLLEPQRHKPGAQYWMARAYVLTGSRAEVERLIAAHDHPFRLAVLYAALDDGDRALEELDRAVAVMPHRVALLLRDPEMAPYRGDPRLLAIARKLKLP